MALATVNGKPVAGNNPPAAPAANGELPPRRVAGRSRTACLRCGKAIPAGELIQRVPKPTGKGFTWVHAGCVDVAAAKAAVPPPAAGGVGIDAEARKQIAELRDRHDNLSKGVDKRVVELTAGIKTIGEQLTNAASKTELAAIAKQLDEVKAAQPREIIVKNDAKDAKPKKMKGCVNVIFDRVLQLAAQRKNIFIPGPTGCGKTHIAGQVAEALSLKFDFISCTAGMSESQLVGSRQPMGKTGSFEFMSTQFIERYEKGGVFLFDEIDAADSNVLLVVNAALANGHLSLPKRAENPVATRHKDFICIAAANTWGTGADRQYVGRNQLDGATLNRFQIGMVPMDYDKAVEKQVCPNEVLRNRLWQYRDKMRAAQLERVVSTRFFIDAFDMMTHQNWTLEDVDTALFSGWRADEISKVKS